MFVKRKKEGLCPNDNAESAETACNLLYSYFKLFFPKAVLLKL